jgi:putative endonuclease
MHNYYVYIMASARNGTLYVGVTSDLVRRVCEHKHGLVDGFTKRYGIKMLVWFESISDIYVAIAREKQIKKWYRKWKLELIERENPDWQDLYEQLIS